MRRHPSTLCALVALSAAATAQQETDVFTAVYENLRTEIFTIQDFELPAGLPEEFSFSFELAGRMETAFVWKHSVRADDFRVWSQQPDGSLVEVEAPPVSTYRGVLGDQPEIVVSLGLADDGLTGSIHSPNGETWFIQPLADAWTGATPEAHVVYQQTENPLANGGCGTDESMQVNATTHPTSSSQEGASADCLVTARIAFDADNEYYVSNGSSVPNTVQDIETIMASVNVIYERDVFITNEIGDIIVRTSEPDPYTTNDPGGLLDQFRTEWVNNMGHIDRDIAHLATGREMDGNIIGLAYVGVTCNYGLHYGESQMNFGFSTDVTLFGHEMGHNWNAPHCLDPSCVLMCGGCHIFGPVTQGVIESYRDAVGCLDDAPATVDSVTPSTIEALIPGTDQTVVIVGDCFTPGSTVSVDGIEVTGDPLPYTIFSDSLITLDMPQVDQLGSVEIEVANPVGGDTITATLVPPADPKHQAGDGELCTFISVSSGVDLILAGDPGQLHFLFYSESNVPSVHPLVNFAIGNNFTDLHIAVSQVIPAQGWVSFNLPIMAPIFFAFYSQSANLTGGAPFETSNVQKIITVP